MTERDQERAVYNAGQQEAKPSEILPLRNVRIYNGTRHVYTSCPAPESKNTTSGAKSLSSSVLGALLDDSEDEGIHRIRLNYNGSRSRYAQVEVQGVPAQGIVDSGADITIIGGELFRRVAAVARLRKKDLKKPNRVPRTYDHRPFTLDGRMDLDLSFDGTTMRIPVYIKMDAREPLLLSEGICRQLGIIAYHPNVLTPAERTKGPWVGEVVENHNNSGGQEENTAVKTQVNHDEAGEEKPQTHSDQSEVEGESQAPIDLAVEKKPQTHSERPEEEKATETSSSRSNEEELVVGGGNHCKQSQTCSNGAKERTESKTRNRSEGWRGSDHGDSFPERQNDEPRSGAVRQPTRRRREVIYVPPRKKQGSPGVVPRKGRQLIKCHGTVL